MSFSLLSSDFIKQAKQKIKFNCEKVQIENRAFRLFSHVTVAILLVCCGLVTLQQLIGNHIECIPPPKEEMRPAVVNQYCFIMSTFTIPSLYNKTIGTEVAHPGVGPYDPLEEPKYHAYYQWVPFALFFQALFFLLPHVFWKSWEGGLLSAYCTLKIADDYKLKQRCILDDISPAVKEKKEKTISKAAQYFKIHVGYNSRYAYSHVLAELLNFIIVIVNIHLTDVFLGYEFSTYGPNVVRFLSQDPENRLDPMSRVFPKVTKCTFHRFGPSGNLINHDVMCVLAMNIINEKIYSFLWFWFVIISILGGLALIYRIITISSPSIRNNLIRRRVLIDDVDALDGIVEKLSYSDWFVLHRLGSNINRLRFGELIQSIHEVMRRRPASPGDSSVSSPPPVYPKTDKFFDPDQELPLLNSTTVNEKS